MRRCRWPRLASPKRDMHASEFGLGHDGLPQLAPDHRRRRSAMRRRPRLPRSRRGRRRQRCSSAGDGDSSGDARRLPDDRATSSDSRRPLGVRSLPACHPRRPASADWMKSAEQIAQPSKSSCANLPRPWLFSTCAQTSSSACATPRWGEKAHHGAVPLSGVQPRRESARREAAWHRPLGATAASSLSKSPPLRAADGRRLVDEVSYKGCEEFFHAVLPTIRYCRRRRRRRRRRGCRFCGIPRMPTSKHLLWGCRPAQEVVFQRQPPVERVRVRDLDVADVPICPAHRCRGDGARSHRRCPHGQKPRVSAVWQCCTALRGNSP